MGTEVETLLVKLEGRITDFEKKMAQAEKRAVTASSRIQSTFNKLPGAVNKAMGLLGAGLSVAGLTRIVKAGIEAGEAIGDLSEKLGITAEQLQQFTFVAQQNGASTEDIAAGFRGLTKFMAQASAGGKDALAVLQQLGLSFDDLRSKSPDEVFTVLLDRIGRIQNPLERNAQLMNVFGKAGTQLAQVAALGAEAIDRQRESAERLGLVISNETVAALQDAGDQLDILNALWVKGEAVIAEAFVPALQDLVKFLTSSEFQQSFEQLAAQISAFVSTTLKEVNLLIDAASAVKKAFLNPGGVVLFSDADRALLKRNQEAGKAPLAMPGGQQTTSGTSSIDAATTDLQRHRTAVDDVAASYERVGAAAGGRAAPALSEFDRITRDATASVDDLAFSQDAAIEKMNLFRDVARTALSTFVGDLREGKSVLESVGDVLDRITDKLLDTGFDKIVAGLLGSAGTLGGANGQLFASGGSVSAGKPVVVGERGAEIFVPRTAGVIGTGRGGAGGGVVVNVINNANASVSQKKSQTPGGGMRLDVTIDEIVAAKGHDPSSRISKMLQVRGAGLSTVRR
jgi:hypothetical protein